MPNIPSLLSYDPLAEAERVTGQSYKDDEATMRLGFGLQVMHSRDKEAALREVRDSYFSMDLSETLALFAEMGFEEVLCDTFTGNGSAETFRILWNPEGLLATVESYRGTHRNAAKVYYNLAVRDSSDLWSRTSSGSMPVDDVWVGDHDAREGIRTNLDRLREVGDFLPVWIEAPFLWLVNYAETKDAGYDYAAINEERIGRLPEHVRDAIKGQRA